MSMSGPNGQVHARAPAYHLSILPRTQWYGGAPKPSLSELAGSTTPPCKGVVFGRADHARGSTMLARGSLMDLWRSRSDSIYQKAHVFANTGRRSFAFGHELPARCPTGHLPQQSPRQPRYVEAIVGATAPFPLENKGITTSHVSPSRADLPQKPIGFGMSPLR